MSAEKLGKDLLAEVKEEGLDELLHSFRELVAPSHSQLGFPPLDRLIDVFQNPPLTQQQQHYQARPIHRLNQDHTSLSSRERSRAVIEITGATACSGKTQLLYYLISLSLLPIHYRAVHLGNEDAVILLDLSGKFSILRLHIVMKHYLASITSTLLVELTDQEISSLVSDSLKHLHVFRPQSSSSLLATIETISPYLLAQPSTHFSTNRRLGLIAINDVSSFLWQDRLDADEGVSIPDTNSAVKANTNPLIERYRDLVLSLRNLQHKLACIIIATNRGATPMSFVAGHRALRPNLPSVWNNFCTVKIVVERDRVSKFGPGISAEEAMKEAPQRWETVEKIGFSGWVNWWDSEGWREEVKEAVRRLEKGGAFSFCVTQQGLTFDVENDCY